MFSKTDSGKAANQQPQRTAPPSIISTPTPRRIVIVTEIPKGATGKLQRIGLAQKLGLA